MWSLSQQMFLADLPRLTRQLPWVALVGRLLWESGIKLKLRFSDSCQTHSAITKIVCGIKTVHPCPSDPSGNMTYHIIWGCPLTWRWPSDAGTPSSDVAWRRQTFNFVTTCSTCRLVCCIMRYPAFYLDNSTSLVRFSCDTMSSRSNDCNGNNVRYWYTVAFTSKMSRFVTSYLVDNLWTWLVYVTFINVPRNLVVLDCNIMYTWTTELYSLGCNTIFISV